MLGLEKAGQGRDRSVRAQGAGSGEQWEADRQEDWETEWQVRVRDLDQGERF